MILYHYTCRDGYAAIERDGWELKPSALPFKVVWLTDLAEPERLALGLTSYSLNCDRTERRVTVTDLSTVLPWSAYCRQVGVSRAHRDLIELADGVQPRRWWVSPVRVPCEP